MQCYSQKNEEYLCAVNSKEPERIQRTCSFYLSLIANMNIILLIVVPYVNM